MDDIYTEMYQNGYIDAEGAPIKCTCGCTEFEDTNESYLDCLDSPILEYDCICSNCGKRVGHWSYGYWEI